MWKGLVALAVALLATSPLVVCMISFDVVGGKYITENNFRHFSPEERQVKYSFANELISYLNKVAQPLIVIIAFFIFVMSAAEYWKFYKMHKEEEMRGEEH
jgi:hypothetical protein